MNLKEQKQKELEHFVNTRDDAIRDIIYNKNYDKFRGLMKDYQPPLALQMFNENTKEQQERIMDVMARKMMWHITNFSMVERTKALAWLKMHGSNTQIGFYG